MDDARFDRWTRSLTTSVSRRTMLGLAAGALGLAAQQSVSTAAKKKRTPKKPKLNTYGCLNVGQACGGNSGKCCSGICEGKKPKKGKKDTSRCIAHNVDSCQESQDFCLGSVTGCGTNGVCSRTTGQASFCANVSGANDCTGCEKDTDCDVQIYGPGAACVVCAAGCAITGNTGCIAAA